MRPTTATCPLPPKVPVEMGPRAMIGEVTRDSPVRIAQCRESICAWTPDRRAHLRGPGLRSIQEAPRRGWMTHKLLACQEESICRRVVSNPRHRTRRPGDSHSGASKSANHPSAIDAVLDAIQQCLHFMFARGGIEQGNWDFSSQRAVWRRQPMSRFLSVTQGIDGLGQYARGANYNVRLLRGQARGRGIHLGIARLLPTEGVTERGDQGLAAVPLPAGQSLLHRHPAPAGESQRRGGRLDGLPPAEHLSRGSLQPIQRRSPRAALGAWRGRDRGSI